MRRTGIVGLGLVLAVACGDEPFDPPAAGSSGEGSGSVSGGETTGADVTGSGDDTDGSGTAAGTTTDETTGEPPPADPSPGCGGDPSAIPQTLPIQGIDREFIVALPDGYDPQRPYPLVFAWHALGTSGSIARTYYQVEESSGEQAIVVYPDGLPVSTLGNQTGWNLDPAGYDLEFYDALYAELTGNLCVDRSRVFSTGHSYGGFMSNLVGCVRPEHMRAIAPVAGGGPFATCGGPVAAWIAHGTVDGTVPFAMGEGSHAHWLEANGCDPATAPVDPSPCVRHEGCDEGVPVVWCAHDEPEPLGGHHWPTWAGPAIWAFFASF